ncbi:unnamed protein product [Meganyctiphanes norvegica]|uniref:Uncharacterized protein n=1 Tax=Meganyctiphanes norvegica TaxID=48144 RepID=A0AAV2QDC9_MEGNR
MKIYIFYSDHTGETHQVNLDRDHTGETPHHVILIEITHKRKFLFFFFFFLTSDHTRDTVHHTDDLYCDFEGFQKNYSHTISMPTMSGEITKLRKKSALVDYSSDATTENYDTLESNLELVGNSTVYAIILA